MIKSKFIQDVLTLLLDGDKDGKEVNGQLEFISETKLNYTGAGVFIYFDHADGIENFKATKSDLVLNGVTIKSSELGIGADSTLFFKNGLINYLELWSFDGSYPKHELNDYELNQEWVASLGKKTERKK